MDTKSGDVERVSAAGSASVQLTKIASRTLARIPKKASALTSQVVPNSRLKLIRLRVVEQQERDAQHEEVRAELADAGARQRARRAPRR